MTAQISVLRNIIEQAHEWRTPIYLHFVDSEKAFDSMSREGLRKIMKMFGIPSKMMKIIRNMYDGFQCAVLDEGEISEQFDIKTGVKQGCAMSGFL